MKQTDYLRRIRRRMRRGAAFAALGLILTLLGFSMRLLHPERSAVFHNAWQMFAALSTILMLQALGRFLKARRVLNSPAFHQERSRIEELDERSVQIEQLAWAAAARVCNVLLFAAMLAALALEVMAVFWVCYVETLVLNGGFLLLQRWYGRKL